MKRTTSSIGIASLPWAHPYAMPRQLARPGNDTGLRYIMALGPLDSAPAHGPLRLMELPSEAYRHLRLQQTLSPRAQELPLNRAQ